MRLFELTSLPTATRTTLLPGWQGVRIIKLLNPIPNRPIRHPGGCCYGFDATPAKRARFCGPPSPSSTLIKIRGDRGILLTNPFNDLYVRHGRNDLENYVLRQHQFR
jgi:hypothetical protein